MASKIHNRVVFPIGCDPVKIWKLIEAFTPTVLVRFEPDNGLYVQCMDQGHTSMLVWVLRPEHCDTYDVHESGAMCVSVPHMIKVLANAGASSTVEWSFNKTNASTLHITVTPKPGSMFSDASYDMRLIDSDEGIMSVPPTSYVSAIVSTKACKHVVTHLRGLSAEVSHVYMYLGNKEGTPFLTCGVETSGVPRASMAVPVLNDRHEIICDKADGDGDDDNSVEDNLTHSKRSSMSYPATLVNKVLDAGKELGKNTRVHWDCNSPLLLTFITDKKGDEEERSNYGIVRVYLAPRSDDD